MNPDVLAELAGRTERVVVELTARWHAGELTGEEFYALAVAALERAQVQAVSLADLAVAASVGAAPLGLAPGARAARSARRVARTITDVAGDLEVTAGIHVDLDRLRAELREPGHARGWYSQRNQVLNRLEQLGIESRSEVLWSAQVGQRDAVGKQRVNWRRRPNSGACEVCTDLAKNGAILPPDQKMWSHKGCGCTQQVVGKEAA